MSLLTIVLIGAILNASYIVFSTKLLREEEGLDRSLVLIGVTNGISGVMLLPFAAPTLLGQAPIVEGLVVSQLLGLVLLMLLARVLHYEALRRIDIALVSPFSALTPIVTIFTSYMVLGESVGAVGVLGIVITASGAALVYYRPLRGRDLADSKRLYHGLLMAFGSCVVPALAITIEKSVLLRVAPIAYSCLFLLISAGLVGVIRLYRGHTSRTPRVGWGISSLVGLAIMQGGSVLLFAQALLMGLTAEVSSLKRVSIVFQVILAYYVLGQQADIRRRLIGVVAVILGIAMVQMF
jgi:drug/metabolite transporter (DMT)-like permease